MATTPPGWYDDGRGALRWWDGAQWTEHVQTPDPEPVAGEETAASAQPETMDTLLAPAVDPAAPAVHPAAGVDPAVAGASSEPVPQELAGGVYAPSSPPGYPGGFPGGAAPSGGFIAATEPKKSKLWILWVVLGVVLLGVVILAAVLIPIVIGLFGSVANSGADGDGETAAVAAVELYDEAWQTADCDKFTEATTESLRSALELEDCAAFTSASQGFIDSIQDYEVSILSVETQDDEVTVLTSETYTSTIDDEGNVLDQPAEFDDRYAYVVVPVDGGWAINETLDAAAE